MTDVIRMRVGQTVKLRFIGTNNNFIHPMHVHGGPFEVVARDGELLPQDARFFADTINVGPGQRYDVIWTAAAFWQCYTTCLYARKDGIEVRSWHFLQRSKIADGLRLPAEERSCSGHHCNDGIWVMNGPKPTSALSPVASQLRTLAGADHLGPLLDFFGNQVPAVGRRAWQRPRTHLGQPCLECWIGKSRVDLPI